MTHAAVNDRMDALEGFATLGAQELARVTHTAERTARRWIRDGLAPRCVLVLLRLLYRGTLGAMCREFDGWTLRAGRLNSPDGHAYSADEIRAIPTRIQQIAALERDLRVLQDQHRHGSIAQPVNRVSRTRKRRLTETRLRRLIREEIAASQGIHSEAHRRDDEPHYHALRDTRA